MAEWQLDRVFGGARGRGLRRNLPGGPPRSASNLVSVTRFEPPPVEFAYSPSGRLAYQVFGEGPNLVAIPPTAQNIEMAWEWPDIRAMLEQFGAFSHYLHFDKRGTGASDRRSRVPGIDERVEDLRVVMDAAAFDSAHLFACSEGGPMAILFAATYPERVDGLIFNGSCAAQMPSDATDSDIEERRRLHEEFARVWGTAASPVVSGFAPSMAADEEYRAWHQSYERAAADSDSLLDLLELTIEMDVREVLGDLDVPTLVIHRVGDRVIPVELGRELAEGIPGARMVELPGDDHFQYAGDVDAWMDEVERFVTGQVSERVPPPATTEIEVRTMGRFAVVRNGEEAPTSEWGSRLARQICKRLVAARRWPVTREQLIDMCWPDESDMVRLSARLSVQLSSVKRMLRGGVVADRSSVRLDHDHVVTDVEEFFAAESDEAVISAYHGEFLPEDVYEDWTGPLRDEVRTRFITSARRLCERWTGEGESDRIVELARRMLEVDQYDDHAHQLLVAALARMGESGEAERAHQNRVATMAEIGVDVAAPGPVVE